MYGLRERNHFSFKLSCLKARKGRRRFIALQLARLLCVCRNSGLYIRHFAHLGNVRGSEVQAQKIHLLEGPNNNSFKGALLRTEGDPAVPKIQH